MVDTLNSAIYTGKLNHRRRHPRSHAFSYHVMMCYLDLDEDDQVFNLHTLWGKKWYSLVRYRRADYFGDNDIALKESVQGYVSNQLGRPINGPVRMLTNFRIFGFVFNPITIYYCFNEQEELQALLLEVSNTPWSEKHAYVLSCDPSAAVQKVIFDKKMHVSPFMPMDILYQFTCKPPNNKLMVKMQNKQKIDGDLSIIFDAGLTLNHNKMSYKNMSFVLFKFPLMTFKVVAGIYWQALRIFLKRIPFFTHPNKA